MIRHVVTLTLLPGTTAEQAAALAAEIATLPGRVPSVRQMSVGTDLAIDKGNATVGICADFDDVGGYEAYRDHPEHQQVIAEHVRPLLASRSCVQFAVNGPE